MKEFFYSLDEKETWEKTEKRIAVMAVFGMLVTIVLLILSIALTGTSEKTCINTGEEKNMFFGKRSLGSLTETECQLVFNKMVLDLAKPSAQKNISHDIGVRLLYSSESYMKKSLERYGYDAGTVKLISSAVRRKVLKSDQNFGEIYGWYVIEVTQKGSGRKDRLEGFAVLYSRDYGFSAENYIRFHVCREK